MEYSKNFNFALPSRDNDVDLADINEISNNFRKIDEKAVKKENIDKKYSSTSENAQSGIAVAEAVKKAGLRKISHIELGTGETATMLKISKDVDGAYFSLHHIMFAARLNLPSAQKVTIRLRTNNGQRYLVYKPGVAVNTILFVSGESKVFSIGTNTNAEYITANGDLSGMTIGTAFQTFASNSISKTNISDVEIFLYDATSKFIELQPGTTLELWGC